MPRTGQESAGVRGREPPVRILVIVSGETVVPAAPEDVWGLVSDPARLPQWWPGVTRVEDEPERRLVWRQEVEESPFERILASSTTEIALAPEAAGTRVRVAIDQRPRGWARFAPLQFRAAGRRQVQGAVEGLDAVFGSAEPRCGGGAGARTATR